VIWEVVVALQQGGSMPVRIFATNKADAEYRAAFKVEDHHSLVVSHVISTKRVKL
jgi:hypothetical protein